MSLLSRSVLVGSFLFSTGIVVYVHYKQQYDLEQLHSGVVRDLENRERRKAQNIYNLQQQMELTRTLQKGEQFIPDTEK